MIGLDTSRTMRIVIVATLALFAAMPVVAPLLGHSFYVDVFARIMIWSIAALGLNLILGLGGMVSFGHAAYIGIGGYTVGILAYHGVDSGFVQWPVGLAASGLVALVFGAISLRTRGVYFIMITLAFAQMIYFLGVSADTYGSNDGMTIWNRSEFAVGGAAIDLGDGTLFYYLVLAILVGVYFLVRRIAASRFGAVIQGARSNETRMQAMGVPTYRYRLAAFVLSGLICGLAGILMANFEQFVSPDMMDWQRSGVLMFMVILGGMASLFGPVLGAAAYLILSELLSGLTEHWHIIFGPFLVLFVLFVRGGLAGLVDRRGKKNAAE
ncbi:MAG: branched-chain amino acid ABC transporter permease [Alphaproteobacteria bacterium]|jgi:branched-chain amino acid transport system permease protein